MDELVSAPPTRRRRVRQQLSLVERLQIRAREARVLAAGSNCASERQMLLQRAEQADTAAEFATDLLPMQSLGNFKAAPAE